MTRRTDPPPVPCAYEVCTFGLPVWEIAEAEADVPNKERIRGGLYRTEEWAHYVSQMAVGTGSCTNARVAAIYLEDADPDISESSDGRSWRWVEDHHAEVAYVERQNRIRDARRQAAALGYRQIGAASTVYVDDEGFIVVFPPDAIDSEEIQREWPEAWEAGRRLRHALLGLSAHLR